MSTSEKHQWRIVGIVWFLWLALSVACARGAAALPKRNVHVLKAEASLHLPEYMEGTVKLGASIRLTQPLLTIPAGVEFIPGQFMLVQGGNSAVQLDGELVAGRQPCFSGFLPGQIRGTFGGNPKFPEWWKHDVNHADTAIRCAVESSMRIYGLNGQVVSLAAVNYYVSKDIPMGGTHTLLLGAGGGRTQIIPTAEWTADWQHAGEWPARAGGNHGAVIWIGGKSPGISSFYSGVVGVEIPCHDATFAHPDKWVSGISSKAGVEENTVIHDVGISVVSGSHIGFPAHNGGIGLVNGLHMERLWLKAGVRRDSVPVLFTEHATNVSLDIFTIDCSIHKSVSADYAATGQSDPVVYPKPAHIYVPPRVAIKGPGEWDIRNGHIEGCNVGIWIPMGNAINQVKLSSIKTWAMCDRAQTWYGDGRHRTTAAPADADQWEFSTAVLLSSTDWDLTRNLKDGCILENIISTGMTTIILSDRANDVNVSAYGQGQFPDQPTGRVTSYIRGSAWQPGNFRLIL